jgi:hypothetical protein
MTIKLGMIDRMPVQLQTTPGVERGDLLKV